MRNILNLKQCVLTGALMLAIIPLSYYHLSLVADPPGVHTRWYDGSVEMTETFYPSGKIQIRTTYGEDGKTVITLKEWSEDGILLREKARRQDGKVVEKRYEFSQNPSQVSAETLWAADESFPLAERQYYRNGSVQMEQLMTEDGHAVSLMRAYEQNGNLKLERRVLDNADQQGTEFNNGQPVRREVMKANGDHWAEIFYDGTEVVSQRQIEIRLTGEQISERFDKKGILTYRQSLLNEVIVARYAAGKKVLEQTLRNYDVVEVRQYDEAEKLTRKLSLDAKGNVVRVEVYAADGSLVRSNNGTGESIDRSLLLPITPPREEE